MSDQSEVLRAKDVHKRYGDVDVLKGVSFDIKRGEIKVICGASGSGKSTLLRCLNLLTRPDEGQVWLEGEEVTGPSIDLSKIRQKIGFVFQDFNLFNHLNALGNVTIGLEKVKGIKKDEARKIALKELERVGLEGLSDKFPAQLSGGQKQRIAIARAIALNPVIMLYDEPTSALDPQLIGEVLDVMKKLAKEKMTSVVVTHEIDFARSVADEMMFIYDGRIIERGHPDDVVLNPQNQSVKRFFEKIA